MKSYTHLRQTCRSFGIYIRRLVHILFLVLESNCPDAAVSLPYDMPSIQTKTVLKVFYPSNIPLAFLLELALKICLELERMYFKSKKHYFISKMFLNYAASRCLYSVILGVRCSKFTSAYTIFSMKLSLSFSTPSF